MCNYKLTVTLEKSVDVVDGGGWVTGMTWRKAVILEAGERASVLALRDLLNGDKPLLEIPPEGAITVHPSPWYGKEGMQQYFSGPLGGIILLEKAAENRMRRMTPREAAGCLFTQLLITRRDADSVRRACALEQALLERTPLWLLQNRGDSAAAELCRDTLSKELTQL